MAQLDEIRRRSGEPRTLGDVAARASRTHCARSPRRRAARRRRAACRARQARSPSSWSGPCARRRPRRATGSTRCSRTAASRELEAQTSLKRGALNLRHAREASTRLAAEIAALRPADLLDRAEQPGSQRGRSDAATYIVDDEPDEAATSVRVPNAAAHNNTVCSGILTAHHYACGVLGWRADALSAVRHA